MKKETLRKQALEVVIPFPCQLELTDETEIRMNDYSDYNVGDFGWDFENHYRSAAAYASRELAENALAKLADSIELCKNGDVWREGPEENDKIPDLRKAFPGWSKSGYTEGDSEPRSVSISVKIVPLELVV